MALTKFTSATNFIQSLADKPAQSSTELKREFDKVGTLLKEYINDVLTEELDSKESNIRQIIQRNSTEISGMLNKVYPVGSIYMSVNNVNPETIFGGTWVSWGAGRVPVGVSASETEFNTVEKTGGEKAHTLSVGEMAQHTHNLNNHTHSYDKANGTGQSSGNTGSTALSIAQIPSHDHSFIGYYHSHGTGSSGYKFLVSKNNISVNSTKRSWPGSSSSGQHYVFTDDDNSSIIEDSKTAETRQGGDVGFTGSGQGHTHSLNNHTHTVNTTSATTGASNVETGTSGSNAAHNNLQPYVTCYMWKRTA